jgi:hypothetical protein
MSGAQRGDLLILAGNNFAGEIAVGPVVVRGGQAHGLDIDSMLIHVAEAGFHILGRAEKRAIKRGRAAVWDECFRMALDQIVQIHVTVRVDVNRADAAASKHDLAALPCRPRLRSAGKRALQGAIYEAQAR